MRKYQHIETIDRYSENYVHVYVRMFIDIISYIYIERERTKRENGREKERGKKKEIGRTRLREINVMRDISKI